MSTPYESATLLIRLYELRREPTMREARNWFAREFNPSTVDEVIQVLTGPNSGHFRMVTSYWEMAASFVLNGAIDEQMFNDANGEQVGVFGLMEPVLAEYRTRIGNPKYLSQLEQVVMRRPGAKESIAAMREWFKSRAAATQKQTQS
jgi:hypothetical protein